MPIHIDILENKVLGREFKRGLQQGKEEGLQLGKQEGLQLGEIAVLRRQIETRFGPMPDWAERRLAATTTADLEDLSVRVLDARSLEDLLR